MTGEAHLSLSKDQRMTEARKLFGFALRNDAASTYDLVGRPATGTLPFAVTKRTTADYEQAFGTSTAVRDLFLYGVADTMRLVLPVLDMHRSLPKEVALKIAQHPETIHAHAIAANQA